MATLQEIREKLKEAESRNSGGATSQDKTSYPFWNMAEGAHANVRFLPDGNPDNVFFWVEKAMLRFPFQGIKGQTETPCIVQVPCMHTWNERCPVISEVSKFFNDPTLEELGRTYWKKRSYIFQGFVINDPLSEEDKPENPIRRFNVVPQLYNLIRGIIRDPELVESPVDYVHGFDFRIEKTMKGKYADYATSAWGRRERPLSQEELGMIETHGLVDLSTYLPKKPTPAELQIIMDMFEASVDQQPYDLEKWGQYFKPYGVNVPQASEHGDSDEEAGSSAEPARVSEPAVVNTPRREEPKASSNEDRAKEIVAMLRNRAQQ